MGSLKLTSVRKLRTLLLLSQLTSMILKDKLPRMLELFPVSMSSELSTSQLPLPSPTVLISNPLKRRTFSSSISEVVLSISPSSPLRKVSSRSRPLTVIPISVEKISITSLLISAWLISRRRLDSISPRTQEPSEDSELNARRPRESSQVHIKPQLIARPLLKVRTTTPTSPEPSSRSSAWTSSESACLQSRMSSRMLKLVRDKYTKSFLSVDLPESQRFNPCFPISSTERPSTNPSTLMRPLLMELLSKPLFSLDKVTRRPKSFFFSMLPHFPWVLRPLVEL